jgi:ribosomal protein S18 acetylase RimI-like enzyme
MAVNAGDKRLNSADFTIRPLTESDAAIFRAIRLEGLEKDPGEFRVALADEAGHDLPWFKARIATTTVFGAFRGEDLVGVAGFAPISGVKLAHKGLLWGMYVQASARGKGLGRKLVARVLEHAQDKVEIIQLTVAAPNKAAQKLYEAAGFATYGIEPRSLKQDGQDVDEVLMARRLD